MGGAHLSKSGYTGGLYIALRKYDDFKQVLKTNSKFMHKHNTTINYHRV